MAEDGNLTGAEAWRWPGRRWRGMLKRRRKRRLNRTFHNPRTVTQQGPLHAVEGQIDLDEGVKNDDHRR